MLDKLDEICMSTIGESIKHYVVTDNGATIIHWGLMNFYHGCAKLYRQRNWKLYCYCIMPF